MKNRIINVVILVSAVTFLSILAFYVKIGATADSVAVLRTTGMTCGSCASKISQALESLKGVAVTEVDVNGGWVFVGYDTTGIKPEALAEKVKETGYYSQVVEVVTPERFKQITGRDIGQKAAPSGGCGGCGSGNGGGCGANK